MPPIMAATLALKYGPNVIGDSVEYVCLFNTRHYIDRTKYSIPNTGYRILAYMLVQAGALKNLPVASLSDEARIGSVAEVVLHPETAELVGFWVQPDGWFRAK